MLDVEELLHNIQATKCCSRAIIYIISRQALRLLGRKSWLIRGQPLI